MIKYETPCCALCQFTCGNETKRSEIVNALAQLKADSLETWNTGSRESGQTAAYVITTPHEGPLVKKLESVGFFPIQTFKRRKGYPQTGDLTMWFFDITQPHEEIDELAKTKIPKRPRKSLAELIEEMEYGHF